MSINLLISEKFIMRIKTVSFLEGKERLLFLKNQWEYW